MVLAGRKRGGIRVRLGGSRGIRGEEATAEVRNAVRRWRGIPQRIRGGSGATPREQPPESVPESHSVRGSRTGFRERPKALPPESASDRCRRAAAHCLGSGAAGEDVGGGERSGSCPEGRFRDRSAALGRRGRTRNRGSERSRFAAAPSEPRRRPASPWGRPRPESDWGSGRRGGRRWCEEVAGKRIRSIRGGDRSGLGDTGGRRDGPARGGERFGRRSDRGPGQVPARAGRRDRRQSCGGGVGRRIALGERIGQLRSGNRGEGRRGRALFAVGIEDRLRAGRISGSSF